METTPRRTVQLLNSLAAAPCPNFTLIDSANLQNHLGIGGREKALISAAQMYQQRQLSPEPLGEIHWVDTEAFCTP